MDLWLYGSLKSVLRKLHHPRRSGLQTWSQNIQNFLHFLLLRTESWATLVFQHYFGTPFFHYSSFSQTSPPSFSYAMRSTPGAMQNPFISYHQSSTLPVASIYLAEDRRVDQVSRPDPKYCWVIDAAVLPKRQLLVPQLREIVSP